MCATIHEIINEWKRINGMTERQNDEAVQGSKLTFQPASQAGLIDCNFYQSAEKLFSP
jgi:hypothetical protein